MRLLIYFSFSFFSLGMHASPVKQFDSIAKKINDLSFTRGSESSTLVKKLYFIAKSSPEDLQLLPLSIYWESYLNYSQGIADVKIHSKIKKELKKYNSVTYPFEHALLLHSLALNEVIVGNYADGLSNSLQALTLYKQVGKSLFSSRASQLLGVICYRTRNFKMAERFSKEALITNAPKVEYYKSLINMYSAQVFIKDKSAMARQSILGLLPVLEKENNLGLLAVAYLNVGATYYYTGQVDKAYVYFTKALNIDKLIDNNSFRVSLFVNVTAYFLEKNDFESAQKYSGAAEAIAVRSNNNEQQTMVYYSRSTLYNKLNDLDSAYFYLQKYTSAKEAVLNSSKTIDSYQSYVSTFLEAAEKDISLNKEKVAIEKKRSYIILFFAFFIILLSIFVLVLFVQKKRQETIRKDVEKKTLEKELAHEKAIQQLLEEKHKEVLDTKVREVTSYSLLLSNKNQVMQELLEHTKPLQELLKGADSQVYKNIVSVINDSLHKDLEGNKFIYHFNEVHPNFFAKLKAACPDLTENNLRMCAYFKMGMSSKQVATILNVSVETIKNARYRLKKKLGLEEDDNLDDFIRKV